MMAPSSFRSWSLRQTRRGSLVLVTHLGAPEPILDSWRKVRASIIQLHDEISARDITILKRTFAWATRFRRLGPDYERLPETVRGSTSPRLRPSTASSASWLARAASLDISPDPAATAGLGGVRTVGDVRVRCA
jgi:hypothetical protein